jgi:hypothetical protein
MWTQCVEYLIDRVAMSDREQDESRSRIERVHKWAVIANEKIHIRFAAAAAASLGRKLL